MEFSLRGTAYRAAYVALEEESVCLVFMVGLHEGFYEKAERKAKAMRRMWPTEFPRHSLTNLRVPEVIGYPARPAGTSSAGIRITHRNRTRPPGWAP